MTRALWVELSALTALAAALSAAVILAAGEWAWSSDALNHHVYLGLIAESPRWARDVLAASVQTYQYPYLYWPVYRLSTLPLTGAQAGAIWSAVQAILMLPPVWLASKHLLPAEGGAMQAAFERIAACALAASSIVVLAAIGTTANDLIASTPLLWAMAIMAAPKPSDRRAGVAAALWGVSLAFKWSHVLAAPLLALWWWRSERPHCSARRAAQMALASALAFTLAYAPWGLQLWRHTGNPVYPHFARLFGG